MPAILEKDFSLLNLKDIANIGNQLFIVDWINDIQKNICLFQRISNKSILLIVYYDDYCQNIINLLNDYEIKKTEWRGYNSYLIIDI